MSTRSRVLAPLAAALMIGFTMTAPAAVASSNNGQSEQASNAGGSAQAQEHRADDAQQSARNDRSSDARADRGDRSAGAERSAEARASAGGNGSGSAGGHSSSNSAVQHERPNDYQAQSDPDGMENGGVDQPGGSGGYPIDAEGTKDQDGNNGTGNDEDCEDDNRGKGVPGHCKDSGTDETPDIGGVEGEKCPHGDMNGEAEGCVTETNECPTGQVMNDEKECVTPGEDEKDVTVGGAITPPKAPGAKPEAEVKGVESFAPPTSAGFVEAFAQPEVRGVEVTAPAALPQTGAAEYLTLLTITGLGMATAGVLTLLFRRRLESGR